MQDLPPWVLNSTDTIDIAIKDLKNDTTGLVLDTDIIAWTITKGRSSDFLRHILNAQIAQGDMVDRIRS